MTDRPASMPVKWLAPPGLRPPGALDTDLDATGAPYGPVRAADLPGVPGGPGPAPAPGSEPLSVPSTPPGGWLPSTGPLLSALGRLKLEVARAENRVQVGEDCRVVDLERLLHDVHLHAAAVVRERAPR